MPGELIWIWIFWVNDIANPLRDGVGMAIFVLVACTQEVFIIGNHFLWLLLVAVLTPQSAMKSELRPADDSRPQLANQAPLTTRTESFDRLSRER